MKQGDEDTISKVAFEQWKMEHASNLARYSAENAHQVEMFKSVILAGQNALKSVILINGGAAVAILAFVGSTWDKSANTNVGKKLLISMVLFAFGVLAGGIASGLTYLAQRAYADEKRRKLGDRLNLAIIFAVIAAYLLFVIALGVAFFAFWRQFSEASS